MNFIKETLEWANRERIARGHAPLEDLLPGQRDSAFSCPIAHSIPGSVCSSLELFFEHDDGTEEAVELPEAVRVFVRAFDDGDLPEYEEFER